jgi:hypothetical protein
MVQYLVQYIMRGIISISTKSCAEMAVRYTKIHNSISRGVPYSRSERFSVHSFNNFPIFLKETGFVIKMFIPDASALDSSSEPLSPVNAMTMAGVESGLRSFSNARIARAASNPVHLQHGNVLTNLISLYICATKNEGNSPMKIMS